MPDGQPPRRPIQARPVQARPVTPPAGASPPPPKPAQAGPVRARPVPGARPPAPPAAQTAVTNKTAVTPKPPAKPRVAVVADDEDDRPVARVASARDDEDDDDRPKKKKKGRFTDEDRRRIRMEKAAEEAEERRKALQEWVFPGILAGIGVLLTIVSAFYHSTASADHAVGAGVMIVASGVYAAVMVPVAIVLLMIVGKLCGIEYGSLGHAFRSLGGILVLLVGVYWTGALFGIAGLFLTPPVASIITYVLFLKMFDLDVDEARTTSFVMNFITWVGGIVFRVIVVSQMLIGQSRYEPEYDAGPDFGDDPPGMAADPDDDFGPDPAPKGKGTGKNRPPIMDDLNGDP
jgi:hypothetical protein